MAVEVGGVRLLLSMEQQGFWTASHEPFSQGTHFLQVGASGSVFLPPPPKKKAVPFSVPARLADVELLLLVRVKCLLQLAPAVVHEDEPLPAQEARRPICVQETCALARKTPGKRPVLKKQSIKNLGPLFKRASSRGARSPAAGVVVLQYPVRSRVGQGRVAQDLLATNRRLLKEGALLASPLVLQALTGSTPWCAPKRGKVRIWSAALSLASIQSRRRHSTCRARMSLSLNSRSSGLRGGRGGSHSATCSMAEAGAVGTRVEMSS